MKNKQTKKLNKKYAKIKPKNIKTRANSKH